MLKYLPSFIFVYFWRQGLTTQAGLKFYTENRLVTTSQGAPCHCLSKAGIKGYHHVKVHFTFRIQCPLPFGDRVFLCISGCRETYQVNQVGPELIELCLPLPPEFWDKGKCYHTPRFPSKTISSLS